MTRNRSCIDRVSEWMKSYRRRTSGSGGLRASEGAQGNCGSVGHRRTYQSTGRGRERLS